MIRVAGKPFLEWLLLLLTRQGIQDFVFCVGYLASHIQDYFHDGRKWNARIRYSVEETPLGTGGALKKAGPFLDESFLVLNGDNYLELDYQDFIARFASVPGTVGMLACWHNHPPRFRANVSLAPDQKTVAGYDYLNPAGKTHVDCGIKIFSRELLSFFDARDAFSLEIDIQPKLACDQRLQAYLVRRPPLDIGTPESLKTAEGELLRKGASLVA
jgi:NDP-sugar pyrophosphorylase family protein